MKAAVEDVAGPSADNPWLSMGAEEGEPAAVATSNSSAKQAAGAAGDKAGKKRKRGKAADGASGKAEDEAADASADDPRVSNGAEPDGKEKTRASAAAKKGKRGKAADGPAQASEEDVLQELDIDGDDAREQRELVRAAFVEGTQAEDFEEELETAERTKEEEAARDALKLAGWGHWTGAGVRPRKPPAPKKAGAETPARKKSRVKVFEGASKVNAKFFVDKVPFPYMNPAQYERQMRMPSGPEWNTMQSHKDRIKPKVVVRAGAVVTPLQYVKHLPPEKREDAIQAWSAPKAPKRLKARL